MLGDPNALRNEMDKRSASDFLRKNGAGRLGSSCFVTPNATCPVCKASVYFYSNASGSRVFFDELGPPWPKHPCTDRPQVADRVARHAPRPERRKIGLIKEIIGKGWLVDRSKVPDIGRVDQPSLASWRLLVITSMRERAGTVEIQADFLETIHQHHITLTTAANSALYVGQFASLKHDFLSFFDEVQGQRRDVVVSYKGVKFSDRTIRGVSPSPRPQQTLDPFGLPMGLKTEGVPSRAQRAHYMAKAWVFTNAKALILLAAKNGATSMADFLVAMNKNNLRTLRGSSWTLELVSCVIYDIRNERPPRRPEDKPRATGSKIKPSGAVGRMDPPVAAPTVQRLPQIDKDKATRELREVEGRILELEKAWDAALTSTQRQKVRDQLDSEKRKRTKLFGMLSS